MGIAGTGVDIVSVPRIMEVVGRHGDRFLGRVFTPDEVEYARAGGVLAERLAGRFAVKEAVLKALGTGWAGGMRWRDIEVKVRPSGRPTVELSGWAAQRAGEMGIATIHVSISHTAEHAIAHAIAETGPA